MNKLPKSRLKNQQVLYADNQKDTKGDQKLYKYTPNVKNQNQ